MSLSLKIVLVLLIFNGIQNIVLAYKLRSIALNLGKKPNYFARMLSDQIFLIKRLNQEENKGQAEFKNVLYYSIAATLLQFLFIITLIITLL